MVVSNSTPLIAFARIGELDLLRRIVGHVVIPAAVWDEITGATNRAGADEVQRAAWIEVRRPMSVGGDLTALLDQGEAQTIALAEELGATEVLLDERAARALASARGLQIIGSAGLLVRAKERGFIDAVQPYLERMRAQGVRFSDRFVRALLNQIGE
jgi:predicted nucleic acid-binding protein